MRDQSKKPLHDFLVEEIAFTGEQDGPAEQRLKHVLSGAFRGGGVVRKAYLARASIDGIATVALALCADRESEDLVRQASAVFAALFNTLQHLDVVFLDAAQEIEVSRVCRAFFERAA